MQEPWNAEALRRALGAYATGVTIVTARDPRSSEPVGFTANSFTSVSLEPPILLVCLAHTAAGYATFRATGSFAVNVLSAEQEETARLFSTRGADKFGATAWTEGRHGAPLIDDSLAIFDCDMHERVTAGDHDVLFGQVIGFCRRAGQALVFHGGVYSRLG